MEAAQQCKAFKEQLIINGIELQESDTDLPIITPIIEHPVQVELASVFNQKGDSTLLSFAEDD